MVSIEAAKRKSQSVVFVSSKANLDGCSSLSVCFGFIQGGFSGVSSHVGTVGCFQSGLIIKVRNSIGSRNIY